MDKLEKEETSTSKRLSSTRIKRGENPFKKETYISQRAWNASLAHWPVAIQTDPKKEE